ncbi:MAG: cyclic nucleotide-binding domain-containing protein [Candidatus Parcubacteria bacterium]|nr:cyclic nucleotide-binding domain-containing protein [Candidatus Parcubacteria bacterium]
MEQKLLELMAGCMIYSWKVMLGCPSEIVKILKKMGKSIPTIIVVPSVSFRYGINQAALEFPLYDFLFVLGLFFKGQKLVLIGEKKQLDRMKNILRLTLLGITKQEADQFGISDAEFERISKISNEMALKNLKDGSIATIDDMVSFLAFDSENKVEIDGMVITRRAENVFQICEGGEEYFADINLNSPQPPALPIVTPEKLPKRSILGALALSQCTSGFDPSDYTSSVIMWINGLPIIVDGVSWLKEHCREFGINPHEIEAFVVTHIHEDHNSILDMVVNSKVVSIMTTKTIFAGFILKTAYILDLPVDVVKQFVKLIEVKVGEPFSWYGAEFLFWNTVHPIPTIGFRVTVKGKSIGYSGDTAWGKKLQELADKGVIDEQTRATVQGIPTQPCDLMFLDAGGGTIHPLTEELALLPSEAKKHLVLTHSAKLTPELSQEVQTPTAGKIWEIIPQDPALEAMNSLYRVPLLSHLGPQWISVLLSSGQIEEFPANSVLLEQGGPGKAFYVILGGTAWVLIDGQEVAQLATGDFFGEISIMKKCPCTATIKSRSPLRVLSVPKETFNRVVKETKLAEILAKTHKYRPLMMEISMFRDLDAQTIVDLTQEVKEEIHEPDEYIVTQGERGDAFYIIAEGKAKVTIGENGDEREIAKLFPGQCFGEIALLEDNIRTANVIAIGRVRTLKLTRQNFAELIKNAPHLRYELLVMASQRKSEQVK